MIKENHINFEKSGRYYTIGKSSKSIKNVWFVFHGYGQLANEFIKEFEILKSEDSLIVAPEASNKFYIHGFTGKIGASWMTKEDREHEIIDYLKMIKTVYAKIISSLDSSNIKINVLGFSQGTHTVVRWLCSTKSKVDNLILWAGSVPRDCDFSKVNEYWSHIKTIIVLGERDRFITKENITKELEYINQQNLSVDLEMFNGKHEIDKNQLIKLKSKI